MCVPSTRPKKFPRAATTTTTTTELSGRPVEWHSLSLTHNKIFPPLAALIIVVVGRKLAPASQSDLDSIAHSISHINVILPPMISIQLDPIGRRWHLIAARWRPFVLQWPNWCNSGAGCLLDCWLASSLGRLCQSSSRCLARLKRDALKTMNGLKRRMRWQNEETNEFVCLPRPSRARQASARLVQAARAITDSHRLDGMGRPRMQTTSARMSLGALSVWR